ncbi:hypothetical protein [Pararhizobium sp. DWP1-1-3]|uniref:hypothetical protein n=1 Tax=Pararhizobium sp. DWP1-1-3 TaxID=2804652 RepID=UPI003CEADCF8
MSEVMLGIPTTKPSCSCQTRNAARNTPRREDVGALKDEEPLETSKEDISWFECGTTKQGTSASSFNAFDTLFSMIGEALPVKIAIHLFNPKR